MPTKKLSIWIWTVIIVGVLYLTAQGPRGSQISCTSPQDTLGADETRIYTPRINGPLDNRDFEVTVTFIASNGRVQFSVDGELFVLSPQDTHTLSSGVVFGLISSTLGTATFAFGCASSPAPTCTDGIQNQNEFNIDCGGVCGGYWYDDRCNAQPLSGTCGDGALNQDEDGPDCGGVCRGYWADGYCHAGQNACSKCYDGWYWELYSVGNLGDQSCHDVGIVESLPYELFDYNLSKNPCECVNECDVEGEMYCDSSMTGTVGYGAVCGNYDAVDICLDWGPHQSLDACQAGVYCDNLDCREGKSCQDGVCAETPQYCRAYRKNGDTRDKIDVVFTLNLNGSDPATQQDILGEIALLYRSPGIGLFKHPPFMAAEDKFNIWYVSPDNPHPYSNYTYFGGAYEACPFLDILVVSITNIPELCGPWRSACAYGTLPEHGGAEILVPRAVGGFWGWLDALLAGYADAEDYRATLFAFELGHAVGGESDPGAELMKWH